MEARPLNLVRPEVPWELAAVVGKMMARDPARRYQTSIEVAQALKPFFKPADAGPVGSKAEVSQIGQSPAVQRVPHPGPPAATNAAPAEPAPRAKNALQSTQAEPIWQNLIQIAEPEPMPAPFEPARDWARPPRLWPVIGAGALLRALSIAWAVRVLTTQTKETVEKLPHGPPSPAAAVRAPQPSTAWTSPSTKMAFVRIEGGEFRMGSPDHDLAAEDDEKPQHRVRISPFLLGVTEVTQAQYVAVMGTNPSHFCKDGGGKDRVAGQATDRFPAEQVSWLDAVAFCNALSKRDGLKAYYDIAGDNVRVPSAKAPGYRLPTEAEWEYACRAGATTEFSFGDDPRELKQYAWYGPNSSGTTHVVGQKAPNGFGLYDMHGNVWEWCWDGYDGAYYKRSPVDNPPGASGPADRVIRGAGWDRDPRFCRSAGRVRFSPVIRSIHLGFRVARVQSGR